MTETDSLWRTTIHVILPTHTGARLLLLPGALGWSLPVVHLPEQVWLSEVGALREAIATELGIHTAVLRCAWASEDDVQRLSEAILVLDRVDTTWQASPDSAWVDRDALTNLTLALPLQRPLLESVLAELDGQPLPTLRPPWARPGWLVEASVWVERELARLGYETLAPVQQFRSWGISAILRVSTTQGDVYFKVANAWPLSAHEPLVMQTLADWYPQQIPAPLTIDNDRRWMLLRDFGPALRGNPDLDAWTAALQAYVPLQRDTADRLDTLWAIGCADRRLETLPAWVDFLVADAETLALIEPQEADRLIALGPHLKELAAKLSDYRLPSTLVHGDLHPGNIAAQQGGYLFYDWTDACIAHPFMDLITVLEETDTLPDQALATARLRDAYLSLWTDYEPQDRLMEAWSLAEPLAALHQVISYRNIYGILEPGTKMEFARGLKYWVRRLLSIAADQSNPSTQAAPLIRR